MSSEKHLPQSKARGKAYVDYSANVDQIKVVVWLPKDQGCDIESEDEVEIRTLSRVITVRFDEPDNQFVGRCPSGCYRFKCDDRGVCRCRVCGQLGG